MLHIEDDAHRAFALAPDADSLDRPAGRRRPVRVTQARAGHIDDDAIGILQYGHAVPRCTRQVQHHARAVGTCPEADIAQIDRSGRHGQRRCQQ